MAIVNLALLVFFCFVLIKATQIVTTAIEHLAAVTRIGRFAITSILLATATSLPEMMIGITAALEKRPQIALGTVVGSNIADISLVIGIAAVVGGSFSLAGQWLKLDIFSVFLTGALPLVLLLDHQLSRGDGIILLLVYLTYNYGVLLQRGHSNRSGKRFIPMVEKMPFKQINHSLSRLFIGIVLLIIAAEMIVKSSVGLALAFSMPVFLIALFLISVGSSLPELSFEIAAIKKRQVGMALGDLLGSVVANSTLILGVVSLIQPIKLVNGLSEYGLAAAAFGVIFILFWGLVRSKKRLDRWEGMVLVLAYAAFMLLEWNK